VPSSQSSSPTPLLSRTDFYREEFLKHQRCLERQREYFSEQAIAEVECALMRILARLDQLCCREDADCQVSALLKKFDGVTRLSAWIDPKTLH
jgi:hypothetical protein